MVKLFSDADKENADKELDCYGYLLKNAIEHMVNSDFRKAAIHHENIARSLHSLADMKNSKQAYDDAWLKWKQVEAEHNNADMAGRVKW